MINSKHEIPNPKQYENSKLECSKHLLDFGHLEFEFVSSFGLPAMPVSKSTEMPENIIVPPTTSRNTSLNAWQAGIRISDFDLVFEEAKPFARLAREFLGHNTRLQRQLKDPK